MTLPIGLSLRLLGLVILVSMVGVPAAAQELPISVGNLTVVTDYPDSVTFELEAASSVAEIVSVTLNMEIRGSGRTDVELAEFVPGREIVARFVWQTLRNGIPPGTPVQYSWAIRDSAGNSLKTDPEQTIVVDSRFSWQTLENDDVALWWYQGDAAFGERIFDSASRALEAMEGHTGLNLPFRIHVVLYGAWKDFGAWHTYRRDWVGGEAYSEMGLTVQIVPPDDSQRIDEWVQSVIPHEIAHLFFHQVTTTPFAGEPPTWLNEGFAQFHEFASHDLELAWVQLAAQRGDLVPLRLLSGTFTGDDERIGLMYAESLSAVVFLHESWGSEGIERLLLAYQAGQSTDSALLEATGLDFEGFQQAWWEWLGGSPGAYPTLPPRAGIPTMPPLATRPPVATPVPTGTSAGSELPGGSPTLAVILTASPTALSSQGVATLVTDSTVTPTGEPSEDPKGRGPCLGVFGLMGAVALVGARRWPGGAK